MPEIIPNRQPVGPKDVIVVDVGCASWTTKDDKIEDSIMSLIQRFKPKILFGFDPIPYVNDGVGMIEGTMVVTAQRAAWTHSGIETYAFDRNCSHIGGEDAKVACFDLVAFLRGLPGPEIILKMDIEGAEYELLPHLIENDAMGNVSRLLIEWHTGKYRNDFDGWSREDIESKLTCTVEEWH